MTRFAWLQSRTQTLLAAALLTALAVVAAVTGLHLSHLYDGLVGSCRAHGDCNATNLQQFLSHDVFLQRAFELLVRLLPAVLGIFWGAPLLARELETGTFRLAWTQGVTRRRWLVTKLVFGAVATAAVTGLLSLTVTWWYRGIDIVSANRYASFDVRDLAPVGYALFAFAAGALAGTIIRRTVPAMAATLGLFVAARLAVLEWVRPHLFAPLHLSTSLLDTNDFGFIASNGGPVDLVARGANLPNTWVQSTQILDAGGHLSTFAQRAAAVHQFCPAIATPPGPGGSAKALPSPAAFEACRAHLGQVFHVVVSYQPASRYWAFQWTETGIFVGLAVLAALGCYWWVTRRG